MDGIEGGEQESQGETSGAGPKAADCVEQELMEVVETDSKGWSYEQPKSEESCWEAGLSAKNDARKTGEFIEERLSRLGLGNHGDEAAKKGGMGDVKVGEDEGLVVSRSILDECVQMVVEEGGLLKKDGLKGIFDADDDEVHEGRNANYKGVKSGKSPRSSWELLRPSSTPRLSAWLLKAGASEAQVLAPLNVFCFVLLPFVRCCPRDVPQLPLPRRGVNVR